MLSLNPNLYPTSGGWLFVDRDGVRHEGSGYQALINTVTSYRQRNGFDLGDPTVEITTQICSRQPSFCKDSNPAPIPMSAPPTMHAKTLHWLNSQVQAKRFGQLHRVSNDVARHRAEICATCPRMMALPTACGSCKAAVAQMSEGLLDGERPVHAGIECCSVYMTHVQTQVHFDVGRANDPGAPPNCWRRDGQ